MAAKLKRGAQFVVSTWCDGTLPVERRFEDAYWLGIQQHAAKTARQEGTRRESKAKGEWSLGKAKGKPAIPGLGDSAIGGRERIEDGGLSMVRGSRTAGLSDLGVGHQVVRGTTERAVSPHSLNGSMAEWLNPSKPRRAIRRDRSRFPRQSGCVRSFWPGKALCLPIPAAQRQSAFPGGPPGQSWQLP